MGGSWTIQPILSAFPNASTFERIYYRSIDAIALAEKDCRFWEDAAPLVNVLKKASGLKVWNTPDRPRLL